MIFNPVNANGEPLTAGQAIEAMESIESLQPALKKINGYLIDTVVSGRGGVAQPWSWRVLLQDIQESLHFAEDNARRAPDISVDHLTKCVVMLLKQMQQCMDDKKVMEAGEANNGRH